MKCGSFTGTIITVVFAAADTELAVTHELTSTEGSRVIPRGFLVVRRNGVAAVYESGTAWTATTAYLKCNTADATCYILFFV